MKTLFGQKTTTPSGLLMPNKHRWLSVFVLLILTPLFNIGWVSGSSQVAFYDSKGEYQCQVPVDETIQVIASQTKYRGYAKVRVPRMRRGQCGGKGYISAKSLTTVLGPTSSDDTDNNETRQKKEDESSLFSTVAVTNDTEAQSANSCTQCSAGKQKELEEFRQFLHQVMNQRTAKAGLCQPQKENKERPTPPNKNDIQEHIADYSRRSRGAIQRAFMALVPPVGHPHYEQLRRLTQDFTDFDAVDPRTLKELLRPGTHDCYRFVKAALSNDYRRMDGYNRSEYGHRKGGRLLANSQLIRQMCGREIGDLVESHWPSSLSNRGGGAAQAPLKERGFINLMESQWGVSDQYYSEATAPEGAVLVYQCVRGGRVLPSNRSCYGDVAIKSKTGYLRDFFTPYRITHSGTRKLVGIYIKPQNTGG